MGCTAVTPRRGNGWAQAHYRDYGKMTYARSVSVIHNIAHQGRAPMAEMGSLEVPDSYSHLARPRPPPPQTQRVVGVRRAAGRRA